MHHLYLKTEILNSKKKNINPLIFSKFIKRIQKKDLIRSENQSDHFCVFFLPLDLRKKQIYLGLHKKAADWIPPGGHIEKNEHPLNTIKREMFEELQFKITNEKIKLLDLTIKNIRKKNNQCKHHYDLWYLVFMNKTNFVFDPREYHSAKWFTKTQSNTITKEKNYREVIQKALHLF